MWKVRASRKEAAHDIPQSMTGRREAAISIWVVEQQEMTKDQCIFPSLLCLSHPEGGVPDAESWAGLTTRGLDEIRPCPKTCPRSAVKDD